MSNGDDAISALIEHSLRRPRFLISLCEQMISAAINRGHGLVNEADVYEGLKQMSFYLVSDFGYELRDVAGTPEDIFYAFIGTSDYLTHQEVCDKLDENFSAITIGRTIELLMWYGFLGVVD